MAANEVDKLRTDIDNLKKDIQGLSQTIKELATSKINVEKSKLLDELPLDELKAKVDVLKTKGQESIDGVEKQIVKNPFKSTAITFGLGFVVAWLFSTKR